MIVDAAMAIVKIVPRNYRDIMSPKYECVPL